MTPLNVLRGELQKLLGNREEFENARYIGRACYVPLEDGMKIKAEFVTSRISGQYDTLQMSAINASEGVVDKLNLRFGDYFAPQKTGAGNDVTPHMWTDCGEISWYVRPGKLELMGLAEAAGEYVNLFRQEQSEDFSMGM